MSVWYPILISFFLTVILPNHRKELLLHVITKMTHSHSVGSPWTTDRPVAQASTWNNTQISHDTKILAPGGNRTRSPSKRSTLASATDSAVTGVCGFLYYKDIIRLLSHSRSKKEIPKIKEYVR